MVSNISDEKINPIFSEEELKNLTFEKAKTGSVLIEHSSPNLFKPFHIGHMVNNSIELNILRFLGIMSLNDLKYNFI